jgi:hypothetical protein
MPSPNGLTQWSESDSLATMNVPHFTTIGRVDCLFTTMLLSDGLNSCHSSELQFATNTLALALILSSTFSTAASLHLPHFHFYQPTAQSRSIPVSQSKVYSHLLFLLDRARCVCN